MAENRSAECALNERGSWQRLNEKDVYIQWSILWLFVAKQRQEPNRQGVDGYLRWGQIYSSSVVNFLLANGLQSLEVDMRSSGGLVSNNVFGHEFPARLYRVYVAEEGDPYCKNYSEQYKYKPQALPNMRRLGLGPEKCIAVKEISEPTAKLRIVADLVPKQEAKVTRAVVSAQDYSDPLNPVTLARSSAIFTVDTPHGKYGSGDHFAHCGSSIENFNSIKTSIWGDRDSSGNTHRLGEHLSREESVSPPRFGSDLDARSFVSWAGRVTALNDSFDATRTIWAEGSYKTTQIGSIDLSGRVIYIFNKGKVLSRQMVFPESWGVADVYSTSRQGEKINVAVVNRYGTESEQYLWLVLDERLNQLDSVLFSKADLDQATKRLLTGE